MSTKDPRLTRPRWEDLTTAEEFRRWYWLKTELVAYCRQQGLSYAGGKKEITERIAQYLTTGTALPPRRPKSTSTFDWAREALNPETVITDSYTNGPNVRRFMKEHLGARFRFTVDFMRWMEEHVGSTLGDAVQEWRRLESRKQDPTFRTTIPEHNEYNRYLRDFFADRPEQSMEVARKCWKRKRSLPGTNRYEPSDLSLINHL